MTQENWYYFLLGKAKTLSNLLKHKEIDKKLVKRHLKTAQKSLKIAEKKLIFTKKCVTVHKV